MDKLDCYGSYEPMPYGCEFTPAMTIPQFKRFMEGGGIILTPDELKQMLKNCEECYKNQK